MNGYESLARFGLPPLESDLPEIRRLLAEDVACELSGRPRQDDLTRNCCLQLFSVGHLEDVLTIWEAKQASFDLHCSVDVQFLCGAGLQETKSYLRESVRPLAPDVLEYIEHCEGTGTFDDFSPADALAWSQRPASIGTLASVSKRLG